MEPNIYTWGKKKQQHIKLYSTRTKGEKKDLQECKSSCLCCLQEIFIDVAELKWLVVTSVASGFALAPKERQSLEHLVCLFLNVQNKKKRAAGLQGQLSWLQNSQISLASSPGFISVKFHISLLCMSETGSKATDFNVILWRKLHSS